ncbi:MAG: hypothetical protein V7744_18305 [Pseudomonadales bacterium]
MTQHEYVFVAISIILGLAITRMLHTVASLIRAHKNVTFHWSSAIWSLSVMSYTLQLWWVGWELRDLPVWSFSDFLILVIGSICIYGATEMALPVPEEGGQDMLHHSQKLGRLSALSMLVYFAIGPYVNIAMYGNPVVAALALPLVGIVIMSLVLAKPAWFKWLSLVFAMYSLLILYLTA